MATSKGLLLSFKDGREIALPPPTGALATALLKTELFLTEGEDVGRYACRLIRLLSMLMETAHWKRKPEAAASFDADEWTLAEAWQALFGARSLCSGEDMGATVQALCESCRKVGVSGAMKLGAIRVMSAIAKSV